jgi:hypothetical protein
MDFYLRDAVEADLDQCLALSTDRFLYNDAELAALRRMWLHVVTTKSGAFAIIADAREPSHVIHFGVVVFVDDDRADAYHRLAEPKIGYAMACEFARGASPCLARGEVARANGDAGLNLVISHHGYEDNGDDGDRERLRGATYELSRRYLGGWNLRSYTNEVFSANSQREGKEMGEALGFQVRRYRDEQLRAAGIELERGPWLWSSTRRQAMSGTPGIMLALLFTTFSPPRFGFTPSEQDLLGLALEGSTDEAIAQSTGASLSTIKKRFRTLYIRVERATAAAESSMLTEAFSAGTRGVETRRHLMNYLREHRQELRPYLARH